jgi:glycine reductase
VAAVGIPHPLGDPVAGMAKEKTIRRGLVERALQAVATRIESPTVFDT